jgi:hypothetical protein
MEFKKTLLSAVVLAMFLGTDVQGVKLGRHGNFSAGKEPSADMQPEQNTFLQTGFVDNDPEQETVSETIDAVMDEMDKSKNFAQKMELNQNALTRLSVQNAKNEISHQASKVLAQTDSYHKAKDVNTLSEEVEKVFNFERDVASAKVQDKAFNDKVS